MQRKHKQRIVKFKCDRCQATFLKESWLQEHKCTEEPVVEVNTKGPFECKECKQVFVYKQSLQRHELRVHSAENNANDKNPGDIQCHLCPKRFHLKTSLRRHLRKKHDLKSVEKLKCSQCSAAFSNDFLLQSHICFNGQSLVCDICKTILKSKKALRVHMVKHDPNGYKLKCTSCGATFAQESSLQNHKCKGRNRSYRDLIPCEGTLHVNFYFGNQCLFEIKLIIFFFYLIVCGKVITKSNILII